MFGDGDIEPSKDNAMLLVEEACSLDLPMQLCQKLARLDFESRKDAAQASHVGQPRLVWYGVACVANAYMPRDGHSSRAAKP